MTATPAEAIHAKDMTDMGKVLVSHDIKPIAFAANYDLETLHVSDNWLRQAEPSPVDKEVQKLKMKLAVYEATEPEFKIKIEMPDREPASVVRIEDLTAVERDYIEQKIYFANPKQDQVRSTYRFMYSYDESYDDRFDAYRKRIPIFMANYAQRLERLFNQARFRVHIANTGKVQAENLLVEIRVSSGWVHDRYVWVSPVGPAAPKPSDTRLPHIPSIMQRMPTIPPHVGRHDVAFKEDPCWRSWLSVTCEDFRHGQGWQFEGIVGIDPRAPDTRMIVSITASNFRGKAQEIKLVGRNLETVHVSKLIDLDTLKITAGTPIDEVIRGKDYRDAIDWKAFPVDNEEDDDD